MQLIVSGYQWAGFCGETTLEKKPDGTKKEIHHNKIWAICVTTDAHVIVRYGSAEHPLQLKEEVARKDCLDDAFTHYQSRIHVKSTRKRERYIQFPFETAPHFLEDFNRYFREKRLKEEEATPTPIESPRIEEALSTVHQCLKPLTEWLNTSCPHCGTAHPSHLIDLGGGQVIAARELIDELSSTAEGRHWLTTPCVQQGELLLHPASANFLGRVIEVQQPPAAGAPDIALDIIPCLAFLRHLEGRDSLGKGVPNHTRKRDFKVKPLGLADFALRKGTTSHSGGSSSAKVTSDNA